MTTVDVVFDFSSTGELKSPENNELSPILNSYLILSMDRFVEFGFKTCKLTSRSIPLMPRFVIFTDLTSTVGGWIKADKVLQLKIKNIAKNKTKKARAVLNLMTIADHAGWADQKWGRAPSRRI